MDKDAVLGILSEMEWYSTGDCNILIEVFSVDGHSITRRRNDSPEEMKEWVEKNVKSRHTITLTIK